jgi:hypothetical protein
MPDVRADCLPLPEAMKGRPVDPRGFPVPWFAMQHEDGRYDLRYAAPGKRQEAVARNLCWVSGEPLGRHRAFVLDPAAVEYRVTKEPPCKRDVALWAMRVCPYLTRPLAQRTAVDNGGNAGVHAVWVTTSYAVTPDYEFGLAGEPSELLWFHRGEKAA